MTDDADNKQRFDGLRRALTWGEGFRLIVVVANRGPARDELLDRLASWSGQDGVPRLVPLCLQSGERPLSRLADLAEREPRPYGVVLHGADQHAPRDSGARLPDAAPAIAELNLHRDELPELVQGPLVLVASEATADAMLVYAPDLWSWRGFTVQLTARGTGVNQLSALFYLHEQLTQSGTATERAAEIDRLSQLVEELRLRPGISDRELADALRRLADVEIGSYRFDEGARHAEEARLRYRRIGDLEGEAQSTGRLGAVAFARSDYDVAGSRLEEALALFTRIGHVEGEANCTLGLGAVALFRLEYETARARFEEALLLNQGISNLQGEANCIQKLGLVALSRSEHDTARARFEAALAIYQNLGDIQDQAACLQWLGDTALLRSDLDTARARFEEALAFFSVVNDRFSMGTIHVRLAQLSREAERALHLAAAREFWGPLASLFERSDREVSHTNDAPEKLALRSR